MKLCFTVIAALAAFLQFTSASRFGAGDGVDKKLEPKTSHNVLENMTAEDCLKQMKGWEGGYFEFMPDDYAEALRYFQRKMGEKMSNNIEMLVLKTWFNSNPDPLIKMFCRSVIVDKLSVDEALTHLRETDLYNYTDGSASDNVEEKSGADTTAKHLEFLKEKFDAIPSENVVAAATFIKEMMMKGAPPTCKAAIEVKFKEDPSWFIDQAYAASIGSGRTMEQSCNYPFLILSEDTNTANMKAINEKFKDTFPKGFDSIHELAQEIKKSLIKVQWDKLRELHMNDRIFITNFYATAKGEDFEQCTQSLKDHLNALIKRGGYI